jgi:hypothetical protein
MRRQRLFVLDPHTTQHDVVACSEGVYIDTLSDT